MRAVLPPSDGELADEDLERLYEPPPGRHVRGNFVMSLDGAIEFRGRSGALANEDDHRLFATLRALTDVVLVGAQTVRIEGYGPAVLSEARRARRVARGQGPRPPVAVVTASGDIDPSSRLFAGAGTPGYVTPLVFTGDAMPGQRRKALSGVAEVVVCGDRWVDARAVIDELAQRGHERVLCEGGPTLLSELLHRGLLDELCLTHTALIAGPGHSGLLAGLELAHPLQAGLDLLILGDGALLGRYRIKSKTLS